MIFPCSYPLSSLVFLLSMRCGIDKACLSMFYPAFAPLSTTWMVILPALLSSPAARALSPSPNSHFLNKTMHVMNHKQEIQLIQTRLSKWIFPLFPPLKKRPLKIIFPKHIHNYKPSPWKCSYGLFQWPKTRYIVHNLTLHQNQISQIYPISL